MKKYVCKFDGNHNFAGSDNHNDKQSTSMAERNRAHLSLSLPLRDKTTFVLCHLIRQRQSFVKVCLAIYFTPYVLALVLNSLELWKRDSR